VNRPKWRERLALACTKLSRELEKRTVWQGHSQRLAIQTLERGQALHSLARRKAWSKGEAAQRQGSHPDSASLDISCRD
jgi:hypothetical protein